MLKIQCSRDIRNLAHFVQLWTKVRNVKQRCRIILTPNIHQNAINIPVKHHKHGWHDTADKASRQYSNLTYCNPRQSCVLSFDDPLFSQSFHVISCSHLVVRSINSTRSLALTKQFLKDHDGSQRDLLPVSYLRTNTCKVLWGGKGFPLHSAGGCVSPEQTQQSDKCSANSQIAVTKHFAGGCS